ncbi:MAG: transposase [Methylococcaceae bacterium]|nr:transposase [Methylococcaceae bacterium]
MLYYKALAEEKFKWPKGYEDTLVLTGQQLNWLLDGLDIDAMKGHNKLHYESVF